MPVGPFRAPRARAVRRSPPAAAARASGKDREGRVALGPHDQGPPRARPRPRRMRPMWAAFTASQRRAELAHEPHRALDVRAQERDRPGRQRSPRRQHRVPGSLLADPLRQRLEHRHRASGRSRRIDRQPVAIDDQRAHLPLCDDRRDPRPFEEHRQLPEMVALLVGPDLPGRSVGLVLVRPGRVPRGSRTARCRPRLR